VTKELKVSKERLSHLESVEKFNRVRWHMKYHDSFYDIYEGQGGLFTFRHRAVYATFTFAVGKSPHSPYHREWNLREYPDKTIAFIPDKEFTLKRIHQEIKAYAQKPLERKKQEISTKNLKSGEDTEKNPL